MADFGFCLPIFAWPGAGLFRAPAWPALDARRCMALGRLADELGYASLWVADHLMLGAEEAIDGCGRFGADGFLEGPPGALLGFDGAVFKAGEGGCGFF